MSAVTNQHETMHRVVVDHCGGPEVLKVVEDDVPRPGQGEVRVRVLATGVSFTDSQLRAGTYIPGGPKPPFTPGYELIGVVEELGPGCSRLHVGDRITQARFHPGRFVLAAGWSYSPPLGASAHREVAHGDGRGR